MQAEATHSVSNVNHAARRMQSLRPSYTEDGMKRSCAVLRRMLATTTPPTMARAGRLSPISESLTLMPPSRAASSRCRDRRYARVDPASATVNSLRPGNRFPSPSSETLFDRARIKQCWETFGCKLLALPQLRKVSRTSPNRFHKDDTKVSDPSLTFARAHPYACAQIKAYASPSKGAHDCHRMMCAEALACRCGLRKSNTSCEYRLWWPARATC